MSSHLAAVATLALAIFFSPETLVLGLIVVGNQQHPRLAAFTYALGGITGIAFATGIGLMIAHISGSDAAALRHDSWAGFAVRVAIAGVLLIIGLTRAANAIRHEPILNIPGQDGGDSGDSRRVGVIDVGTNSIRLIVAESGCLACHAIGDAGVHGGLGPDLSDIGANVPREAIKQSVAIGPGIMPSFQGLGEENLNAVADYLASLQTEH